MKVEFKWWDALVAVVAAAPIVAFTVVGPPAVNFAIMGYAFVALGLRIWWAFTRGLVPFALRPFANEHRAHLVQAIVRCAFLGVWALVLVDTVDWIALDEEDRRAVRILLGVSFSLSVLLQFVPGRRVYALRNIALLGAAGYLLAKWSPIHWRGDTSEDVSLAFPMRSDAVVGQGGRSSLVNHHFPIPAQRDALDILAVKDGATSHGPQNDLASYACFGEPIVAPRAGRVVEVLDGRDDVPIGGSDTELLVGNHVVLEIGKDRFVLFAHLKRGSIAVHEGDSLACGAPIAQCGNSGNTSEPHLHLQVQNKAHWREPDVRTFPMVFTNVGIDRPLRRNDVVHPAASACE